MFQHATNKSVSFSKHMPESAQAFQITQTHPANAFCSLPFYNGGEVLQNMRQTVGSFMETSTAKKPLQRHISLSGVGSTGQRKVFFMGNSNHSLFETRLEILRDFSVCQNRRCDDNRLLSLKSNQLALSHCMLQEISNLSSLSRNVPVKFSSISDQYLKLRS